MIKKIPFKIFLYLFILFISAPTLYLFFQITDLKYDILQYLWQNLLLEYIKTSSILVGFTILFTAIIGVSCAWFTARYSFKYDYICHWLLLVPLSMPSYIMAYAYTDLLQFSAPIQSLIREFIPTLRFFDIRSLPVAIFIFVLNLYPYVYLLCYSTLCLRNNHTFEVAKMLGENKIFLKVALPLVRPSLIAALALVGMEVLSDYGTVSYFGLQTFSLGIYRSWLVYEDKITAILLALILLVLVFIFLIIEYKARQKQRFYTIGLNKIAKKQPIPFRKAYFIWLFAILLSSLALLVPIISMLVILFKNQILFYNWAKYLIWLKNTIIVAAIASFLTVFIAFILNIVFKSHRLLFLASLGYAVPGTILAIGILGLIGFMSTWITLSTYLSASIWILVYAYFIRFYAIAHQGISNNYQQLSPNLSDVSLLLGLSKWQTLIKVYIPLLKNSLFASFLLVGIDSVKELPCTLLLRPFNFDTFAVISYQLASDERIAELSIPALTMIFLSLLPMFLLHKKSQRLQ